MYCAILVGGDKVWCSLPDLQFARHIFLNELDDIYAMIRNVYVLIDDSDISGFVDNERNAIRGVESFHYPTINFADRKFSVCKQRKTKLLSRLEFFMRLYAINANAKHHGVSSFNAAQLIPERAQLRCSATGKILGIKRQYDVLATEIIGQVAFNTIVIH